MCVCVCVCENPIAVVRKTRVWIDKFNTVLLLKSHLWDFFFSEESLNLYTEIICVSSYLLTTHTAVSYLLAFGKFELFRTAGYLCWGPRALFHDAWRKLVCGQNGQRQVGGTKVSLCTSSHHRCTLSTFVVLTSSLPMDKHVWWQKLANWEHCYTASWNL